jgi:hypothetical protein
MAVFTEEEDKRPTTGDRMSCFLLSWVIGLKAPLFIYGEE